MKAPFHTVRFFIEIIATIAVAETAVMFILPVIAPGIAGTPEAILDAAMLSILAGPVILWRVRAAVKNAQHSLNTDVAAAGWRLKLEVVTVLALGLGGSGVVAWKMHQSIRAEAHARFETLAEKTTHEVKERINRVAYGLNGLEGLYLASKSVERVEFQAYVGCLDLPKEFPGVLGFGFIQRVMRTDLAAFTTAEQADQAPDFSVKVIAVDPAGLGEALDLYVVKFIEPRERNRGVWGFDIGSEAVRRTAVEQAVRTGEPTLSGSVQLVQNDDRQTGMLYMRACYRNGTHPTTPEQREAALAGIVYAPFVLKEALADLHGTLSSLIDLEIFDGTVTEKSAQIFDLDDHLATATGAIGADNFADRLFHKRTGLTVGGRALTVTLSSRPAFDAAVDSSTPVFTALIGATLTMLGVMVLWTISAGRARAIALAGSMTLELREAWMRSERLAEIARRTSNAVIITDAQGRITWINEGFTKITGYTLEEVLSKVPGHLLGCDRSDPKAVETLRVAQRRGVGCRVKTINRRKDRREYVVDIEVQPLHDEAGMLTGFMAIESDITEQVESKAIIASNEARFRSLVEGTDVIVFEFDPAANCFTYVSPQAHQMGYPQAEWMTPGFWEAHIHERDRDRSVAFCKNEAQSGRMHRFQHRMLRADGSIVWIDETVSVEMKDGKPGLMRGVMMDITEQVESKTRIARSEARLRTIIDAEPECVKVIGTDGTLLEMNPAGLRMLEAESIEQVRDHGMENFVAPNDRVAFNGSIARALRGETDSLTFEVVGLRGTRRWLNMHAVPLRDDGGLVTAVVSVTRDITQQLTAELQSQNANAKLISAQATAEAANHAKSEFLANMSHEIRTPLTAIMGYADLLREDGDMSLAPTRRMETIDTIRNAGTHLLTVINDILDISKIEADKMTVERVATSVPTILHEVVSLIRPRAAGKGVTLTASLASPVPDSILSDPTRLRQILMNLVGNSAKFTEEGTVSVTARVTPRDQGQRLVIDVDDTGPGMTTEQAGHLFQSFSQSDNTMTRKHGGTGLGLTICRRLAALMGGEVTLVRTEVGKGSCFRVELPLEAAPGAVMVERLDAVVSHGAKPAASPTATLTGRILLVEDGLDNQRLIAFHLRKAGATVDLADNGRIALKMIDTSEADTKPYDLVLTDMQMPEMDGYTLARTLRDRGSRLAIVALTAHAMAEDRQKCIDSGCDDYAAKPIEKAKLLATCAAWIGKASNGSVACRAI